MQFDFLLPGLIGAPSSVAIQDCAPALASLLTRGTVAMESVNSTEHWIARRYGLGSEYSLAAVAWHGEQRANAAAGYCLRADPVHFSVNRDRMVLLDAGQLDVTADEADALRLSLQALIADDELTLTTAHPERWYIFSNSPISLQTYPVNSVRGQNVANFWFDGAHRAIWQNRLSEMQMLLHAHPVNAAREDAGTMPINGIWIWGAGTTPKDLPKAYNHIVADDPLLVGVAALSDAMYSKAKDFQWDATTLPQSPQTLFVLSQLDSFAAYGEWEAWRSAVAELDRRFFALALASLRSGKLNAITIYLPDKQRGVKITTTRYDLLKFWRRDYPAIYAKNN
jgi:hypothetical protein